MTAQLWKQILWFAPSSFANPWWLLALLIPLAMLYWVWRPKTARLVLPYDHGPIGRGSAWRMFLKIANSLPPLLLATAIFLLAGPQQFGQPKEKRSLTNIEICLDVSGSMTAEFGNGSRYDAAMQAIDQFLTFRKGDACGLTFFGNEYLHWCPLTTDMSAIRCSPPFMRPENAPPHMGGTEIGKAIKACRRKLEERPEGDKMILLVTDGSSFDLSGNEAEISRQMNEAGIKVFAVMIGDDPAQDELRTITHMTGGESFDCNDVNAMPEIFKRIDQMKPAKVEKTMPELADNYLLFASLALGCLTMMTLSAFGLRTAPW